jgi:hypothetical protein
MAQGFGQFGNSAARLGRTSFFSWFNFTPGQDVAGPGERAYRPSGEAFRDLVVLWIRAGADGRLQALTLRVARSFIDDAGQGAFARDLVKSFLENLDRSAATKALVDEIFFRGPRGPMIMRGAPPALPAEPSPAFRVFAGQSARWKGELGGLPVTFANDPAGAWFEVGVSTRGRPSLLGWLSAKLRGA